MEQYADIIIDLSVKNVDRIFQYRIPAHLREAVKPGVQVNVPFGKGDTVRKGIVVGLSTETDYDPEKMKELMSVEEGAVPIRTQMICLAFWMKDRYATTMNQALKTVLPVKVKVTPREERLLKTPGGDRDAAHRSGKEEIPGKSPALPGAPGKR